METIRPNLNNRRILISNTSISRLYHLHLARLLLVIGWIRPVQIFTCLWLILQFLILLFLLYIAGLLSDLLKHYLAFSNKYWIRVSSGAIGNEFLDRNWYYQSF